MATSDQTIRDALLRAQTILAQYAEPGGPNEKQIVKQLFGILNSPAVIAAVLETEGAPQKLDRRRQSRWPRIPH